MKIAYFTLVLCVFPLSVDRLLDCCWRGWVDLGGSQLPADCPTTDRNTLDATTPPLHIVSSSSSLLTLRLTGDILKQDGVPGLFRGLTATREMPGYFFFFLAYEATRHVLTPVGKMKDQG